MLRNSFLIATLVADMRNVERRIEKMEKAIDSLQKALDKVNKKTQSQKETKTNDNE